MNKNVSDIFCILPWIHFASRNDGRVQVCCKGKGFFKENNKRLHLRETKISDIWNSTDLKEIRTTMLKGEIPESCEKCFYEEKLGNRSKRLWENDEWNSIIDVDTIVNSTEINGHINSPPIYIHLDFGRECNCSCITCGTKNSTLWDKDIVQLKQNNISSSIIDFYKDDCLDYDYKWYENDTFWKDLEGFLPEIKRIYAIGGEPTIINHFSKFINSCIDMGVSKNIELRLNTNGIVLNKDTIKLWSNFKDVRIEYSLDLFEEKNEYIRYPSKWNNTLKSLKLIDGTPDNFNFLISCTISIFNVFYIPDFVIWKLDQGFKKFVSWPNNAGLIGFHYLYNPEFLNIQVLPAELKKVISNKYDLFFKELENRFSSNPEFSDHPSGIKRFRTIVNYMNEKDLSSKFKLTKEFILKMDKIRGLSFEKTFPEIRGYFN